MGPCEHRNTHPGSCDDCEGKWCYVCGDYHEYRDKYVCISRIHQEVDQLHDQLQDCLNHAEGPVAKKLCRALAKVDALPWRARGPKRLKLREI